MSSFKNSDSLLEYGLGKFKKCEFRFAKKMKSEDLDFQKVDVPNFLERLNICCMPIDAIEKMYVDWLWCPETNRGKKHKKEWKKGLKKLDFHDHHFVVVDINKIEMLVKVTIGVF